MTKAEKEAAKLAAKAEKEAAPTASDSEDGESDSITFDAPFDLKPRNLPFVVKLPKSASSGQKEYAKVLNAYAYQNPKKWASKKAELMAKLESLAGVELGDTEEINLSIRGSKIDFRFVQTPDKKWVYAPSVLPTLEE